MVTWVNWCTAIVLALQIEPFLCYFNNPVTLWKQWKLMCTLTDKHTVILTSWSCKRCLTVSTRKTHITRTYSTIVAHLKIPTTIEDSYNITLIFMTHPIPRADWAIGISNFTWHCGNLRDRDTALRETGHTTATTSPILHKSKTLNIYVVTRQSGEWSKLIWRPWFHPVTRKVRV